MYMRQPMSNKSKKMKKAPSFEEESKKHESGESKKKEKSEHK